MRRTIIKKIAESYAIIVEVSNKKEQRCLVPNICLKEFSKYSLGSFRRVSLDTNSQTLPGYKNKQTNKQTQKQEILLSLKLRQFKCDYFRLGEEDPVIDFCLPFIC